MTKIRFLLLTTLGLGILSVACSGKDEDSQPGDPTGGVGAMPGTGGMPSTGGGMPTGGGGPLGGALTGGVGTLGGSPAGGAPTGGMGASATGGVGASATGGVGASPSGGVGATGTGGEGAGGAQTGGAPPVDEPSLITSSNGSFWQEGEVTDATGTATVTVNDGQELGDWDGFGGTFNEKGWQQLMTLSAADRLAVMQALFSKTNGIGFALGRIPIGSSDYGISRYSLDETANDTSMASFSIQRDLDPNTGLIPYIKAALEVNPDIWFWGSPWSPPTWMKNANTPDDQYGSFDSPYDAGTMKNESAILEAHALYLARFVQAYAAEGIVVSAVHPQNEPGWAQHYPSCSWSDGSGGYLYNEYIKDHLAPTFQREGVTAEIWLGTLSNSDLDNALAQEVFNDAGAKALISGIGLQWEMLTLLSNYTNKGVKVWQTEHKCGNYPWETSTYKQTAPNDYAYAKESWGLIRDWIRGGVTAYLAWNMVLDNVGRSLDEKRPWAQNALITVQGGQYTLTPTYYVFRHAGQYVDPGAKRVQISSNEGIAFKNPDGSIVATLYSQGGGQTTLSAGGRTVQFQIPADGWATVNLQP